MSVKAQLAKLERKSPAQDHSNERNEAVRRMYAYFKIPPPDWLVKPAPRDVAARSTESIAPYIEDRLERIKRGLPLISMEEWKNGQA